jgi:hypothetical protein
MILRKNLFWKGGTNRGYHQGIYWVGKILEKGGERRREERDSRIFSV